MRITNIMFRKRRRGVSTILGTIIFIGILFTSVIPLMLVMKQADTIYTQKVHQMEILDEEGVEEDVNVYVYPYQDGTELGVKVENIGNVPITVVRAWLNDESFEVNEVVPAASNELFGPYNVSSLQNGTSVDVKIVTERGNVFYCISGGLTWYEAGGWSTTSLGICVIIHNTAGGWYRIILHNITGNSTHPVYESHSKEWADVVASTPVDDPGLYEMIVQEKKGSNWKDLPGSPVPANINYPNGPPFIMIWIQGK